MIPQRSISCPQLKLHATPTIPSILASIYLQWLFIKQPCLMCADGMLTAYTHVPTNQVPCSTLPLHLHFVFMLFTLFPVWEQWTSNQSKWSSSLRLLILCVILAYPFLGIGQGWAHIDITYAVPKLSIRLDSSQQQVVQPHISGPYLLSKTAASTYARAQVDSPPGFYSERLADVHPKWEVAKQSYCSKMGCSESAGRKCGHKILPWHTAVWLVY